MKKIFGSFFKGSSSSSASQGNKIALITNYNACPLGLSLTQRLTKDYRVIAVSHKNPNQSSNDSGEMINTQKQEKELLDNPKIIPFTAHLNEETDRNRLIAFLKSENITISRLIHNQPYMIKPTAPEKMIDVKNPSPKEQNNIEIRVNDLKEKIRILIETSLFINSDLLDQNLIDENARILQIIQKQIGIYGLLRASQINLRKCLSHQLQQKQIGMTSLLPGIYQEKQIDYLSVSFSNQRIIDQNSQQKEDVPVQLLNPDDIAKIIIDYMLHENIDNKNKEYQNDTQDSMDLATFCGKPEWDIYELNKILDKDGKPVKAPKIYTDVYM